MAVHVYIIKLFAARQIVCSHSIPVHISDISLAENRKLTQKISDSGLNCLCLRISEKCDSHRIGSDVPLFYSHILCFSGPKNTKIPPSNQKFLTPFEASLINSVPSSTTVFIGFSYFHTSNNFSIMLKFPGYITVLKRPQFYICVFIQHQLWLLLC